MPSANTMIEASKGALREAYRQGIPVASARMAVQIRALSRALNEARQDHLDTAARLAGGDALREYNEARAERSLPPLEPI